MSLIARSIPAHGGMLCLLCRAAQHNAQETNVKRTRLWAQEGRPPRRRGRPMAVRARSDSPSERSILLALNGGVEMKEVTRWAFGV